MEISDVIRVVKDSVNEIIHSKHFIDQCGYRNLNQQDIEKIIRENKILGVLEQNEKGMH